MADRFSSEALARNLAEKAAQAELARAVALHQQGKLAEAEALYHAVLQRLPGQFDALHLLGVIAVQTARPQLGAELIAKAIGVNRKNAAAHSNLGNALRDLKRPADALVSYDRALKLQPDFPDAHNNRGNTLLELKRAADALASYDRAIRLKPDYAEAHSNRGNALRELKRLTDALASYEQAISLRPNYAQAHANRAGVLRQLKRSEEALASYDTALSLNPNDAEAHSNRGIVLRDLQRLDEALASYERAIALDPGYAEPLNNRGNALSDLHRFDEALASYDKAIALRPDYADAHFNRALCLLLLGRYEQGLPDYEWRWRCDEVIPPRPLARPLWLGRGDIAGKTLLLWWEQGLGDTVQFARFAPALAARGAKVVMSVQEPLRRLLRQLGPGVEIVGPDTTPTAVDLHCPLMSLPLALGLRPESVSSAPYLKADEALQAAWRARLPATGRRRVGIAWSGGPAHKKDRSRSIEWRQFRSLLTPDADWIVVQKDVREGDAALLHDNGLASFGNELADFADTAALLSLTDLLITVDTSVAHVAGAMGKPVWLLLPYNPDWRWLLDRDDTPWYPSVRLFRQQRPGDWAEVLGRVSAALRALA